MARQLRCPFSSLCVFLPDHLKISRACRADARPSCLPLSVFLRRSHSLQPTAFASPTSTTFARLPPSLNKVDSCLVIGAGGIAPAAIHALHALGAGWVYQFNRTQRSGEELDHAIPDANVELLDTLDVASVQRPPLSVILPPLCRRLGRRRKSTSRTRCSSRRSSSAQMLASA